MLGPPVLLLSDPDRRERSRWLLWSWLRGVHGPTAGRRRCSAGCATGTAQGGLRGVHFSHVQSSLGIILGETQEIGKLLKLSSQHRHAP